MINLNNLVIAVFSLMLLSFSANSALTVNVIGVVTLGSCTVNNGETINVDFGNNLPVQTLDGEKYKKNIDYSLSCEDLNSNALVMQFSGAATSFDANYLATDKAGLGIKLYMDGQSMPVNTWVPFTWPNVPVLEAAPIASDTERVDTGVFTASATLKIQYE